MHDLEALDELNESTSQLNILDNSSSMYFTNFVEQSTILPLSGEQEFKNKMNIQFYVNRLSLKIYDTYPIYIEWK